MRIVQWRLDTGMQGCVLEGEIEVDDDTSEEEIERLVREEMWGFLSLTWEYQIPPAGHVKDHKPQQVGG